ANIGVLSLLDGGVSRDILNGRLQPVRLSLCVVQSVILEEELINGGETKIRITPQLMHGIFDEYPVVAKAYSKNLTEESFWKRYFQSKLFNAHRASIRSTATWHVVKDDPILNKYFEKEDDGLEPRQQRNDTMDVFVDLAATLEDCDSAPKPTPNRKRHHDASRPTKRHSPTHPQVQRALGKAAQFCSDEYAHLELDDLRDPEAAAGIILEIQDRQCYFEGRSAPASAYLVQVEVLAAFRDAREKTWEWERGLVAVCSFRLGFGMWVWDFVTDQWGATADEA
ncbi:hypothetical protein DXG01_005085, partial [Tephrocybe rancida]